MCFNIKANDMRKIACEVSDKAQKSAIETAKTLLLDISEKIQTAVNEGHYSVVFTLWFENKTNLDQTTYCDMVKTL